MFFYTRFMKLIMALLFVLTLNQSYATEIFSTCLKAKSLMNSQCLDKACLLKQQSKTELGASFQSANVKLLVYSDNTSKLIFNSFDELESNQLLDLSCDELKELKANLQQLVKKVDSLRFNKFVLANKYSEKISNDACSEFLEIKLNKNSLYSQGLKKECLPKK